MFIRRILTVEHLELDPAGGGVQLHRTTVPMHQPPAAEGENFAVAVGFFLQSLLQSLACPLASFGFYFHLNFPQ